MICNICHSPAKSFVKKGKRNYYKCIYCQHVFVPDGTIKNAENKTIYEYDSTIFHNNISKDYYFGDAAFLSAQQKFKILKIYSPGANQALLDIGSNYGHFLYVVRNYYKAQGLEISPEAVAFSIKNFDVECTVGKIEDLDKYYKCKFDIVTLWDVIEHIDDPINCIEQIKGIIKSNGTIFISTPKYDSFISKLMGKSWYHLNPEQHINIFSSKNLVRILKKAGFEIKIVKSLGHKYKLNYIIGKISKLLKFGNSVHSILQKAKLNVNLTINIGDVMLIVASKI